MVIGTCYFHPPPGHHNGRKDILIYFRYVYLLAKCVVLQLKGAIDMGRELALFLQ